MNQRCVTVRVAPIISPELFASYRRKLPPVNFTTGDAYGIRDFVWAAHSGVPLENVLPQALKNFNGDEKQLWSLVKGLARRLDTSPRLSELIKIWILCFWDKFDAGDDTWSRLPGLSRWNSQPAGVFIEFMLRSSGMDYATSISPDAYRKLIARFRRQQLLEGVHYKKLVTRAKFQKPRGPLVLTGRL